MLALDKTGTLTLGAFRVSGRHRLASAALPLPLVRRLAGAVEAGVAHHRLAAAVVEDGEAAAMAVAGVGGEAPLPRVTVRAVFFI